MARNRCHIHNLYWFSVTPPAPACELNMTVTSTDYTITPIIPYCYYTNNWDLGTVTLVDSTSNAPESDYDTDVGLSIDGSKLYLLDYNDGLHQYTLNTPFDLSTKTYDNIVVDPAASLESFCFCEKGINLYILSINTDKIYQYVLTTPWDINSAILYDDWIISTIEPIGTGIEISCNGSYIYIVGTSNDRVSRLPLTTPFDISSADNSSVTHFSVSSQTGRSGGIDFTPDGSSFFLLDANGDKLLQYDMTTPWDQTTASYIGYIDLTGKVDLTGIHFNIDGSKFWIDYGGYIYEYTNT